MTIREFTLICVNASKGETRVSVQIPVCPRHPCYCNDHHHHVIPVQLLHSLRLCLGCGWLQGCAPLCSHCVWKLFCEDPSGAALWWHLHSRIGGCFLSSTFQRLFASQFRSPLASHCVLGLCVKYCCASVAPSYLARHSRLRSPSDIAICTTNSARLLCRYLYQCNPPSMLMLIHFLKYDLLELQLL